MRGAGKTDRTVVEAFDACRDGPSPFVPQTRAAARERVLAALDFHAPDCPPVEYHSSPAGFLAHGQSLLELWRRYPDDFGPPGRFRLPSLNPALVDAEGRYYERRLDDWGVVWEHLIFGAAGFPVEQPLKDWAALPGFRAPTAPSLAGPEFRAEQARARAHREAYFLKSGWISLFELMHALRPYEEVLMDIAADRPEIHRLADLLTEHHARTIEYLLARGVDAVQFGDDFGTQCSLMLSPAAWRRFFKPRYAYLMDLVHRGGARVFFHSCGRVRALFDDLAALGIDAIWPQQDVYDTAALARYCRESRIAIALHPDRGQLMIQSSPACVRDYVLRLAETFRVSSGGAWFYVEVDHGYPIENVIALTESIASLRTGGD